MNADCARWVIDRERQLKQLHHQRRNDAGHQSRKERSYRSNQSRTCARRHQSREPAIRAQTRVGFAKSDARHRESGHQRRRRGEQRIHRGDHQRTRRSMQPEQGTSHVPCQPSHQRDQAAQQHVNHVVPRHRRRQALARKLALARTRNPHDRQRREAAERMNCRCAASIKKSAS